MSTVLRPDPNGNRGVEARVRGHYLRAGPWLDVLRDLHRRKWTDAQIAVELSERTSREVSRRAVRYHRRQFGLKGWSNQRFEGMLKLADMRDITRRDYAGLAGWGHLLPGNNRRSRTVGADPNARSGGVPRVSLGVYDVAVLTALRLHGPLTAGDVGRVVTAERLHDVNAHLDDPPRPRRPAPRWCAVYAGRAAKRLHRVGLLTRAAGVYALAPGVDWRRKTNPTSIDQKMRTLGLA